MPYCVTSFELSNVKDSPLSVPLISDRLACLIFTRGRDIAFQSRLFDVLITCLVVDSTQFDRNFAKVAPQLVSSWEDGFWASCGYIPTCPSAVPIVQLHLDKPTRCINQRTISIQWSWCHAWCFTFRLTVEPGSRSCLLGFIARHPTSL